MHAHLLLFLTQLCNDCHNFLDEWAASMNLYYRKSATLVLKLSQEGIVSSVVTGDNPAFPVQAAITLMVTRLEVKLPVDRDVLWGPASTYERGTALSTTH